MKIQTNPNFKLVAELKGRKVDALLHLQRCLSNEEYENCQFWSHKALNFGATRKEILFVLKSPNYHIENFYLEN